MHAAPRKLAWLAVMAGATGASAQPTTKPAEARCTVRVLEAPDAVRAEIERWVRAEPRCWRELDVRVTRTRAGLRLVAIGSDGRVRERVIPDAQSAAVLVVSWMADDSIDDALDAPPAAPLAAPLTPPGMPPRGELDTESPFGPSLHGRAPAHLLRHRWLSLGAAATDHAVGLHAQVDVLGTGAWSFGVAGGWRQRSDHDVQMSGAEVEDGDATLFAAYTRGLGPVDVRAQVGLGVELTRHEARMTAPTSELAPKAQAGAFVRLHLGEQWGVLGGPLLDAMLDGHAVRISGFLGVERRL